MRSVWILSPHATPLLCHADLRLIHSEVVSDLVPQRLLHHSLELRAIASHILMWTLEDRDAVGHGERFAYAAQRKRPAFIQAELANLRARTFQPGVLATSMTTRSSMFALLARALPAQSSARLLSDKV